MRSRTARFIVRGVEIVAKNDGQRLLIACGDSLAKIAAHAGTSKSQAHAWKHGTKLPPEGNREALFEAYGIALSAWDCALPDIVVTAPAKKAGRPTRAQAAAKKANPPTNHKSPDPDLAPKRKTFSQPQHGEEPTPVPPYPARPTEDASAVANVQYQLDCIRHDLEHEPLSVAGKSKLRADESRAMTMLLKFKKEEEMAEDRFVRDHPAWQRFTEKILAALAPHTEASKAVLAALRECEQ